ncbi:MAG TPA: zinc-binding alcohol dehydrogenase family protein [Gemmatimonadaceae bacterium]|jgi:NADPH:quinone reductase-like Zn-dependent oxidoreductase
MPTPPFGTIAEFAPISRAHLLDFPASVSSVTAAAIAIPGMSSWAALNDRAHFVAGETVLVNGATGTSGQLAVQIAKHLGAARVIATGRNAESLAQLEELGADITLQLGDGLDAFESSLEKLFSTGIDVVLDYLWGDSARATVIAAAKGSPDGIPIRFVHIGAASSPSMDLPSAALRSSSIELMGSGIGSIPFEGLRDAIRSVLEAAGRVTFKTETTTFPLSDVAAAWTDAGRARTVVTIP